MRRAGMRTNLSRYPRELELVVDRKRAAFSAWYELMPRSQSDDPNRHGTFDDVIAKLPYVRDLGFDVLYFPPIHPIGRTHRKGKNNSLTAEPDDPGSPYAIGSDEGGHDAIHPELGTFEDFARLVDGGARARAGDRARLRHPVLARPSLDQGASRNGSTGGRTAPSSIAENPPKKYEDIVNVHFYGDAFPSIWYALRDIVLFWVGQGREDLPRRQSAHQARARSGNG